jgi:hypothetical protein
MGNVKDLEDAIAHFEALRAMIIENNRSEGDDWRRILVELRRRLQNSVAEMRTSLDGHRAHGLDADLYAKFVKALSQLRSAIAQHQAEWPAVVIDAKNSKFLESAQSLRTACLNFKQQAAELLMKMRKNVTSKD